MLVDWIVEESEPSYATIQCSLQFVFITVSFSSNGIGEAVLQWQESENKCNFLVINDFRNNWLRKPCWL